jgi:hypothetical protein
MIKRLFGSRGEEFDDSTNAVGIINEVWNHYYGQTMLVDRSVTEAMQATHVTNNFAKSKWPSQSLTIKFEDKEFYEIIISKGHQADLIRHAWAWACKVKDEESKVLISKLSIQWGPDTRGIPAWFDDVIVYTIKHPYGHVRGNLPSECGETELRCKISEFIQFAGYDENALKVMENVLMALKVINYSAIPFFAPSKIDRGNKKAMKEVKKRYKIDNNQPLYRVVYLPRVVRQYQEKNGQKKSSPLKNGRVGHLRTLHSDYFVNKQGQDIFIPPIPDSQGRYPKIIYKVKKHKEAA